MLGNLLITSNISILSVPPILVILFVSIIFILVYLYRTSEVMNKKILFSLITIAVISFITTNVILFIKNEPKKVDFRLTFFPLQGESKNIEQGWEANAFWKMLTEQLSNIMSKNAVILSSDWTSKIINPDSAKDIQYLNWKNKQIDGEYFLTASISSSKSTTQVHYQMIESEGEKNVLNGSVEILPEELPVITLKISNKILEYFGISPHQTKLDVRMINSKSYGKYLVGLNSFQSKEYKKAVDFAEQSIAEDSSLTEAYLLAGKSNFMIALEQKQNGKSPNDFFRRSVNFFTKTIELDSSNGEAYSFLGEYDIYRERWSLAETNLVKAYELNPQNPRLYLSMSRLHDFRYRKLGFKNEEQLFRQAIFYNPCYEEAYLMLSDFYLYDNKKKQAIDVLEKILEINPASIPVLMALGKIYLVRNDILKIVEVFNRVIKLDENNSDAYYNLGILYYNSKDFDNAEKFFKRAIAIDNHLNSHLYLAYLYDLRGDKEKAIEQFRDRIRYRKGLDDEYAEEARKRLFDLLHGDSLKVRRN